MDTKEPEDQLQPGTARPTAKPTRRRYSIVQKLEMVKATFDDNQSVSVVARQYDVNANQLFRWRKQYRDGLLVEDGGAKLLPIQVCEAPVPDAASAERAIGTSNVPASGTLEVTLPTGHQIRITGVVCQHSLATVLGVLS